MRPFGSTGAKRRAVRACAAALGLAMIVTLPGCSFRAQNLPLPGGPELGDRPYEVTAEFSDVLDLVPRSVVKVSDVTVGEVESVELDGYTARVTMRLRDSVELPDNATARIRQTSLLGEKFVSLDEPQAEKSRGRLGDGDLIRLDNTGRNVEVEEVLSALSALLNGGGVGQLKTIQQELNKALDGREADVRQLLRRLERVVAHLDDHKEEITDTIDRLDALAADVSKQRETIGKAVDELPGAAKILADQRKDLTTLLTELDELGEVGTRVIDSTQEDLVANLEALDPVLTELNEAGDSLPKSLEVLFTYPFTDSTQQAIRGDYTNMQLTLDTNLQTLLNGEGPLPLPPLLGGDGGDGGEDGGDGGNGGEDDDNDQDGGGGDDDDPKPPDEDDEVPCPLPLLCSDDDAGATSGQGRGTTDGAGDSSGAAAPSGSEDDTELDQLLMGGIR